MVKKRFHIMQKGRTVCPENWGMVNESALFYRIYYIYGGDAWLCRDNTISSLKKDHLYLFPVMEPYTLWHDPQHPLDVLWFHVEMEMNIFQGFPVLEVRKDGMLYHLLESMRLIMNEAEYAGELRILFGVFLKMLEKETPFGDRKDSRMSEVLQYMKDHLAESVQVQELADIFGMERSYFSRKFKSVFQMSPIKYISAMKMSAAARYLLEGASVYQAAVSVGYTDEKAFSRAFKVYMEVSPGQYKKSHILQP